MYTTRNMLIFWLPFGCIEKHLKQVLLADSFNDELITLIPKKDTDTSEPSYFRPISLLGVDVKIFTSREGITRHHKW